MKTQFSNLAIPNRILSSSKIRIKFKLPAFSDRKTDSIAILPLFPTYAMQRQQKNAGPTDHACPALRIYPIAEVPLFHSNFIYSVSGTNYIQSGSDRNTEFIAVFFCYKLSTNIVDSHLQRFYGRNNVAVYDCKKYS